MSLHVNTCELNAHKNSLENHLLHVVTCNNMRTSLQLDQIISKKLKILAEHENRTKVDEIRFLVKKELESLGISCKPNSKTKLRQSGN